MKKIILACMVSTILVKPAFAWGTRGHEVVALIAEAHLSEQAEQAVQKLLQSEGAVSLADVAAWADHVRKIRIPRQPSHNLYIPLDFSEYNAALACRPYGCILPALKASVAALKSKKVSQDAKAVALNYVVHYVGDLHQPLHTSADAGEWDVDIAGKRQKFHAVWDSGIIRAQHVSAKKLAEIVEGQELRPVDTSSPTLAWAMEGRDIARDIIFKDKRLVAELAPVTLPDTYLQDNWPVVRMRLKQAGYRLAALLNDIYGR